MKNFLVLLTIFCLVTPAGFAAGGGLMDILDVLASGGEKEAKAKVTYVEGDKDSENEILLVKIRGVIQESDDSEIPFEMKKNLMENLKKDLDLARDRQEIKGILLDIDSPGGEITASDIIHYLLKKIRKNSKKIVIAHIGMLGASGAYYIACASDQIWANPTSIIGSIGVIMHGANVEALAKMIGYRDVTLKSDRTPKKDVMSPFREMTPEERKMMMSLIDGMYERFVQIVAEGRKKKIEEIYPLADGSLFNAQQALQNGLIDGIGYRDEVLESASKLANVKSVKLDKRRTKKSFSEMLSDFSEMRFLGLHIKEALKQILDEAATPRFIYQLKLK